MIEIHEVHDQQDCAIVRDLFKEYQKSLGVDLCFQNFDEECDRLPGDYSSPNGRLILARNNSEPVGCVGLRAVSSEICELKRLYVRPTTRATGLGRKLAEYVIDTGRAIGYKQIALDTLPSMTIAIHLYEKLGFVEIAPYRLNPIPGARFLGLML